MSWTLTGALSPTRMAAYAARRIVPWTMLVLAFARPAGTPGIGDPGVNRTIVSVERHLSLERAMLDGFDGRRPIDLTLDITTHRQLQFEDRPVEAAAAGVRAVSRALERARVSVECVGTSSFSTEGASWLEGGTLRFEAAPEAARHDAISAVDANGRDVPVPVGARLGTWLPDVLDDVRSGGLSRTQLSGECLSDMLWFGGHAGIEVPRVPDGVTDLSLGSGVELAVLGWLLIDCRGSDWSGACWANAVERQAGVEAEEMSIAVDMSYDIDAKDMVLEFLTRHHRVLTRHNTLPIALEGLTIKYRGRGNGNVTRDVRAGYEARLRLRLEESIEIRMSEASPWGTLEFVLSGSADVEIEQYRKGGDRGHSGKE